jgi:hypothetical protein
VNCGDPDNVSVFLSLETISFFSMTGTLKKKKTSAEVLRYARLDTTRRYDVTWSVLPFLEAPWR